MASLPDKSTATVDGCTVAGEGAVSDGQRAIIEDAATVVCTVAGESAARDGQRPAVEMLPPPYSALLPEKVLSVTVSVPLEMPPRPSIEAPSATVMFSRFSCAPDPTRKTRKLLSADQ